jgi:catechol 2,3-dioxygenase-like lactoylglutathione lyase family enzyme
LEIIMSAQQRPELGARLYYIELGSPDPLALARFYERAFSAAVSPVGTSYVCRGPDRVLIASPGQPKTLISAGYALKDKAALDALQARLIAKNIEAERTSSLEFADALALRDPSGNRILFGVPKSTTPHVEGLSGRIQHVVVASRNAQAMVDFYTAIGLIESDRVLDDQGALRTVFLRTDHEHHSFAVFQASEDRFDHHCYEASDWNAIRDWGDHFASFRIPVKWGPGRHGPGNNLFLFVHDPDGNWVEISAEIEVTTPDRPTGQWPHEEYTLNSWGSAPLRS